jgi:hypothetical protein
MPKELAHKEKPHLQLVSYAIPSLLAMCFSYLQTKPMPKKNASRLAI